MLPYVRSAKSSAACSVESNTKLVVRCSGSARAPVLSSGGVPACSARVRNPKAFSLIALGFGTASDHPARSRTVRDARERAATIPAGRPAALAAGVAECPRASSRFGGERAEPGACVVRIGRMERRVELERRGETPARLAVRTRTLRDDAGMVQQKRVLGAVPQRAPAPNARLLPASAHRRGPGERVFGEHVVAHGELALR